MGRRTRERRAVTSERTAVRETRLGRVADGREFEEFFRAELPGIVRALYLLVPDRQEAEELAQESMARAFERWDRVRGMDSPVGYVYRTAVNLNRRRLRRLAIGTRKLASLGTRAAAPPPDAASEVAEAIASLPKGQREAFMLVGWLGMSAEEAGRLLGIAPASVRSRVHRARTVLRDRLRIEEEADG
jgi:RNA polymerase sigma-70 factor, ECF subfamily